MASRRPPSDDFGEDEPTVIDGEPLLEPIGEDPLLRTHDPPPGEYETPVDVVACHECGAVCVLDDYSDVALHAFPGHCLRAKNGRWWWCSKFRKSVTYVPE